MKAQTSIEMLLMLLGIILFAVIVGLMLSQATTQIIGIPIPDNYCETFYGDADLDNSLTCNDPTTILEMVVELKEPNGCADFDKDYKITGYDAAKVLSKLAEKGIYCNKSKQ